MMTNKLPALIVMSMLLALCHSAAVLSQEPEEPELLYSVSTREIHIGYENLVIQKDAGKVRFTSITEMDDGPDIQLRFENDEKGIMTTVTIYRAPDGTLGPRIAFGEDGKPKPADTTQNPNAIFELTEPSESFTNEFNATVNGIEALYGLKSTTGEGEPLRLLAVPTDMKNSPIAYSTRLQGTGEHIHPELKDMQWVWDFRLYVVGEHFVKIHTSGPMTIDTLQAGIDITRAIRWIPEDVK